MQTCGQLSKIEKQNNLLKENEEFIFEHQEEGVRSSLKSVMTTLKSPTIIQKIFTDRVCSGDKTD